MDRRDPMAFSGPASYYMQREQSGSQGIQQLSTQSSPFQSNVGVSSIVSTLAIEPLSALSSHGVMGASSKVPPVEPVKRKRGRPRKYGHDGSHGTKPVSATPLVKRGRGRPPGSGRKQHQLASLGERLTGSAGMGFTPHVITVAVGEDVATKIMSFSQQGPRAICILSANGAVSTITLRQPSSSGGTVTYEGRFEIICLSGSYVPADNESRTRTGSLSVSLASPDGRVIGGGIGGVLIAATPIQVIVGSFLCSSSKTKKKLSDKSNAGNSSNHHTVESSSNPTSFSPTQNVTPLSSLGIWPSSQALDMQNSHLDIDLMRG